MGFIFSPCVCHAELPCGIRVPRAASRAGPGHQHSGKGDQEASVLLPLCLQDTVLEALHEGVENVRLWGNEANHRADLPEMTVPLPVTKSTSARGSPGHGLQVTTEAAVSKYRNVRLAALIKPPGRFVLPGRFRRQRHPQSATTSPQEGVRGSPKFLLPVEQRESTSDTPAFLSRTVALASQEEGHRLPLQDGIKAIIATYNAWK